MGSMAKRKKPKRSKPEAKSADGKVAGGDPRSENSVAASEQESMDFGGLSRRDLKKNLGCG